MHGYTKLQVVWLLLLSSSSPSFGHGSDSDVQCLKDLKQSLIDPNGVLESSWNFTGQSTDYNICFFTGVLCWHRDESRVLGLVLGNLGLEGPFPRGLELCSSMTTLDLSGNKFSGPLPGRISDELPYVTNLDLSNNSFSGGIPASIGNMTRPSSARRLGSSPGLWWPSTSPTGFCSAGGSGPTGISGSCHRISYQKFGNSC